MCIPIHRHTFTQTHTHAHAIHTQTHTLYKLPPGNIIVGLAYHVSSDKVVKTEFQISTQAFAIPIHASSLPVPFLSLKATA